MNMLYGKQRKALKIIYKNYKNDKLISKTELSKKLKLDYQEITQLCKELHDNGFIDYVGLDYNPKLAPKGIDYFSTESGEWLSNNIISILAIIISLVALCVSIFK